MVFPYLKGDSEPPLDPATSTPPPFGGNVGDPQLPAALQAQHRWATANIRMHKCTSAYATATACAFAYPAPSANRSLGASDRWHIAIGAQLPLSLAAPLTSTGATPSAIAGTSHTRNADDHSGGFPCHSEHRSNADSRRAPIGVPVSCSSRTWMITLSRPRSRPGCGASVAGCTIYANCTNEFDAIRPTRPEPSSTVRARTLPGDAK